MLYIGVIAKEITDCGLWCPALVVWRCYFVSFSGLLLKVFDAVAVNTSVDATREGRRTCSNCGAVDFPNLWTVEYSHPAIEQQKPQDALDRARDCLDDGGLLDFYWAQCT
jgi:hypothetical protein